jgi:hypothetical protein
MNQDVHDALCFALWHHQGGSSTIGQPIRKMLDLGPHDYMDEDEIKGAKRVLGLLYPQQRTWVGLTWHDVPNEWVGNVSFMEGAKWAETKLKEKHT